MKHPPTGTPLATVDGRPFVRDDKQDDGIALWMSAPVHDGDPVYCCGNRVGTFHGDAAKAGGWYIELLQSKDLPASLKAWVQKSESAK